MAYRIPFGNQAEALGTPSRLDCVDKLGIAAIGLLAFGFFEIIEAAARRCS
jgi:hypothetical protein